MTKWIVALVMLAAAGGCLGDGDDDVPGTGPSGGCELVVDDASECPSVQELCRPGICGAHDCCYPTEGGWGTVITDCFDGCGPDVDAPMPIDGPPPDGCRPFDDGGMQASSALPHC